MFVWEIYFIIAHSLNNSLSVWPHTTIQTKHRKDEYALDNLMLGYEWCIWIVRNSCLEPVTALMQSIKDQYKVWECLHLVKSLLGNQSLVSGTQCCGEKSHLLSCRINECISFFLSYFWLVLKQNKIIFLLRFYSLNFWLYSEHSKTV